MGTVQSNDVGAAHNVVNGVAFLALTLCSLVASKCLVVLPRGSCENYGFFFFINIILSPLPFLLISFVMAWVLALERNIHKGGSGAAL